MDTHWHDVDGRAIYDNPAEVTPPAAELGAVEAVADADVEIAKVQAARDVELAKIDIKREELWQEGRVQALEGELRGVREILEKIMPPEPDPAPAPAPIVIPAAAPDDEGLAPAPEPVDVGDVGDEKPKKSGGFFGPAYH